MNILIVTATAFESELLMSRLTSSNPDGNVTIGHLGSHAVSILHTGIGMINTAYHLTKALINHRYDLVLNIGICGAYHRTTALGSVVEIREEIFSELGATDAQGNFIDLQKLGFKFFEKNGHSIFNHILNAHQPSQFFKNAEPVIVGRSLTVNTVNGDEQRIADARKRYDPDFENMEGGAVAFVCLQESIPYLEFRSISNYVEPRNTDNWQIRLASQNVQNFILNLITARNP
ncbi:futalosine hydrolase [bacterium]|nr:futalosine hydrolase [bacterium]